MVAKGISLSSYICDSGLQSSDCFASSFVIVCKQDRPNEDEALLLTPQSLGEAFDTTPRKKSAPWALHVGFGTIFGDQEQLVIFSH